MKVGDIISDYLYGESVTVLTIGTEYVEFRRNRSGFIGIMTIKTFFVRYKVNIENME